MHQKKVKPQKHLLNFQIPQAKDSSNISRTKEIQVYLDQDTFPYKSVNLGNLQSLFQTSMIEVYHPKFIDIEKSLHAFPEEVANINFSVTLLHYHKHAHAGTFLVYLKDFSKAEYVPLKEINEYYPCSWFLKNGKPEAYEFSDEQIETDMEAIEKNLMLLESMGYQNYGTSVRPIRNVVELQTKTGHVYIPREKFVAKEGYLDNQTATNGKKKMDSCHAYSTCVITSTYAHATDYGHDVY